MGVLMVAVIMEGIAVMEAAAELRVSIVVLSRYLICGLQQGQEFCGVEPLPVAIINNLPT